MSAPFSRLVPESLFPSVLDNVRKVGLILEEKSVSITVYAYTQTYIYTYMPRTSLRIPLIPVLQTSLFVVSITEML